MPRRSYKNSPSKKSTGRKPGGKTTTRGSKKSGVQNRSGKKSGVKKSVTKKSSAKRSSTDASSDEVAAKKKKPVAKKRKPRSTSTTASTRDQPQRLQRLLAAAGFGSRRQCESMIQEGRVSIDGDVADQLGTIVDPSSSKVVVDGVPLRQQKLV